MEQRHSGLCLLVRADRTMGPRSPALRGGSKPAKRHRNARGSAINVGSHDCSRKADGGSNMHGRPGRLGVALKSPFYVRKHLL